MPENETLWNVFIDMGILNEEVIRKVYYHLLSRDKIKDGETFFCEMLQFFPDSYEVHRCLAEVMMKDGKFQEAVTEWLYIIKKLGMGNINILSRLFRCYMGLGNMKQMEKVERRAMYKWPEHKLAVEMQDMCLSYCNERHEIDLFFDANLEDLPTGLSKSILLRMKRKDCFQFSLKRKNDNLPFIIINYKNGEVIKLYPVIMEDLYKFRLDNLPQVSELVLCWGDNEYRARVSSKRILGVLEGKNGWLFLDNDTNKSVDQFCGRSLMLDKVQAEWRTFLDRAKELPGFILFVPPSKESVFPRFYPHEKSMCRPIDQLHEIVNDSGLDRFFYPCDILSQKESSYSKTDTHYTFLGAELCFEELIKKYFDFSLDDYRKKEFSFESRKNIGDLGSKMSPMRDSEYVFLKETGNEEHLIYSNDIENTGRVEYYKNKADYLSNKKVLIFGDSFSHNITPFFHACFMELLVCRTVGTIHMDLIEKFKPDYVISEMTERFIVRAPQFWIGDDAKVHSLKCIEIL
ncbi:hypothetical protein [Selenomonas sp. KH1T6]|uniref:hypothetical protein n=1 Tax=Selenomonas sp. KH1T6 TaxID=3158784 RepID=UPI0008A794A3|nr:hypothetical protein SAMN05216583_11646 [Selenomonas ruminantium]